MAGYKIGTSADLRGTNLSCTWLYEADLTVLNLGVFGKALLPVPDNQKGSGLLDICKRTHSPAITRAFVQSLLHRLVTSEAHNPHEHISASCDCFLVPVAIKNSHDTKIT